MDLPGKNYFDDNYACYERQNCPAKINFYLNLLGRHLSPGSAVFELGVGLGIFLQAASQKFACSGCDINAYALDETRKKIPGITLFTGSYESVPVNNPINAVVAWDVLEHIPQLDDALKTIYNRLQDNGLLFGVVPVYDGPLGPLVHKLDKDPTHVWKISRGQWKNLLVKHGFKIVESGGILRKLIFSRYYLHLTCPQWLWRNAGVAFFFAAQKTTQNG